MSAPHPVIGVLRAGMLLGLGWVAAAGLAGAAFGVFWAMLPLVLWVLLLRRFHQAVEGLARAVAASQPGTDEADNTRPTTPTGR